MASPRTATITTSSPIAWSDSTLFDGFLLVGIALPTLNAVQYSTVALDAASPPVRLPQWFYLSIKQGVIDPYTKLYFSADIDPPNTKYAAYFYDVTRTRIAPSGAATLFQITSTPYTITVPTLTAPTATATAPQPE